MIKRNPKIRQNLIFLSLMLFIVFMTATSDTVSSSVKNTLKLSYASIIPSLFPFMVLSTMATKTASHLMSHPCKNTVILIPFILGALCGFPVGAVSIAILFENGVISKSKAEYFCALCNNTGPAFIIGIIGKEFWHSISTGIVLYICQISSSLFVFIIWFLIFGKRRFGFEVCSNNTQKTQNSKCYSNVEYSFCTVFCTSVKESSLSVLKICGFIAFFKGICDVVQSFFHSEILLVLISSVLEFTTGSLAAAKLGSSLGMGICGFAIGFSGLSVIAQSADFLCSAGLSVLPMLKLKFISGLLCGIISGFLYDFSILSEDVFYEASTMASRSPVSFLTPTIVFFALFLYFTKKIIKLINHDYHRV